MNKTESYCYQKYKLSSNNSCVIKEKNIVGKNLLEGTYFDDNGIPKMIGITKAEYLEYKKLQQENKQLKYNWNKLIEDLRKIRQSTFTKYGKNEWENCLSFNDDILPLIEKMKELEQGNDSNEKNKN